MEHTWDRPPSQTLENLFRALNDPSPEYDPSEYDAARKEKLAKIEEYIRQYLKCPENAAFHAEAAMAAAEERGAIHGGTIDGEIGGFFTVDGNPIAFTI